MLYWILLLAFGIADCASQSPIPNGYRLPNHTRPTSYAIHIETGIVNSDTNIKGKVTVDLKVLSETSSLKFHMKDLSINKQDTILLDRDSKRYIPREHGIDIPNEMIELIFNETLHEGDYKLNITYTGKLRSSDEMIGFYASHYFDEERNLRPLAATQFETSSARYAFPCWDEPEYRAVFNITLKYEKTRHALSNMPMKRETVEGDWKITEFEPTPPMSSYLVAFVVSDYVNVTNEFGNFTVWAPKNQIHKALYARDIGIKLLRAIEDYTGIPYMLPKIDFIPIPNLEVAAMGNWGLVTFRNKHLFYDENVMSKESQFDIALTIARELVHQWFGNLVGTQWWEWLWLNKGFATYLSYQILEKVEPTWKPINRFVNADISTDASPMNHKVKSEGDLSILFYEGRVIFDDKAASVTRMMSFALSEGVFQRGLRYYLTTNSYKVANSDILFESLQKAVNENSSMFESGFDVKKYMDPWVNQAGYPMIQVVTNVGTNTITITQQRFSKNKPTDEQWYIPLNFVTGSNPQFDDTPAKIWLKPNETLTLKMDLNNTWILVNPQRSGYYRVNYDKGNWKLIGDQLANRNHTIFDEQTIDQLIDDSLTMVDFGKADSSMPLEIFNYFHKESNHALWKLAFGYFDRLDRKLPGSKQYGQFYKFVAAKLEPYMNLLKYEAQVGDDSITKKARTVAMKWACRVGIQSCLDFFGKYLLNWLGNPIESSIPKDIFTLVKSASCYANSTVWRQIYDRSQNESDVYNAYDIDNMLACSHSDDILMNWLNLSLIGGDKSLFLQVASKIQYHNPSSSSVLLKFMLKNIDLVINSSESAKFLGLITGIGRKVKSSEDFVQLKDLISELHKRGVPNPVTENSYREALANQKWMLSNRLIEDWLSTWKDLTDDVNSISVGS